MGLILGALLIIVSGSALATGDAFPGLGEKLPGNCRITLWPPKDTAATRCRFMDEVMVGLRSVDPLVIKCSRLEVQCNRADDSRAD